MADPGLVRRSSGMSSRNRQYLSKVVVGDPPKAGRPWHALIEHCLNSMLPIRKRPPTAHEDWILQQGQRGCGCAMRRGK